MKISFIQQQLCKRFSSLGKMIALHPFYFFLIPIFGSFTLILSGLFKIRFNRDYDYLFTAENGIADRNKKLVEATFPMNTSKLFDFFRITDSSSIIIINIEPKDERSIFRESIIKDITELDRIIRDVIIYWGKKPFGFQSLCGKKEEKCASNRFQEIVENYDKIQTGKYKVKYPVDINLLTFTIAEYVSTIGGVELDDDGYVKDAKVLRLLYPLDVSDKKKEKAIRKWKNELSNILRTTKFRGIYFYCFSEENIIRDLNDFTKLLFSLMPFIATIVLLFCVLSSMTNNCLRSKPWLGVSACCSTVLGVASGFGFIFNIGVEYMDYVIFLSYSTLVLEVDDAFVLIATWRRTNPSDSVQKRMADTYYHAGVSVTVTSLTNFTSLCMGILIPVPAVRICCTYAASAMFFTYLYQMTFFGASMALSGYREEKMLSPFFLKCTNGNGREFVSCEECDQKEFVMTQFRNKIGYLLTLKPFKVIIVAIFTLNLSAGLYGLRYIKSGRNLLDALGFNSDVRQFGVLQYKHFNKYSYPFHIIIDQPLNYADRSVQKSIEDILEKIEALPHIADYNYRSSWLKYYNYFCGLPAAKFLLRGYEMSDKEDFIAALRNVFLRFPKTEQFKYDIVFNENFTDIVATRFLLPTKDINSQDVETQLIRDVNEIVDKSLIKIKIFCYTYHHLEQELIINKHIIQTGIIATTSICLICFIFLPYLKCVICITFVIVCIIFEVIGYMSFWNVNLDFVFLLCFVLCVGFSINHPTHVAYSFMMSKQVNPEERIKDSIYELGYPIFQGSLSTVLGLLVFAFQPFSFSISLVKLICSFAFQTAFHSIFVIPVFLDILAKFDKCGCERPRNDYRKTNDFMLSQRLTEEK